MFKIIIRIPAAIKEIVTRSKTINLAHFARIKMLTGRQMTLVIKHGIYFLI